MSDDDDWGFQEKSVPEPPQPKVQVQETNARGRGRRGQPEPSQANNEPNQNKDKFSKKSTEQLSSEPAESQKRGRSANRHQENIVNNVSVEQNISDIIHPSAVQLKPEEEESSWIQNSHKNQTKKEETNVLPTEEKEEKEENGGRGNRGNRGNRGGRGEQQTNEGGRFNNRGAQQEGNGGEPRRGNRGNRQGQQDNRGGFNRDYNRDNKEGDGNRNFRNYNNGNDREGGGFRRNREDGDNRGNNNWRGQNRGEFRGRGRGGFGDRGDRGDRGERDERGERGDRGGRGGFRGGDRQGFNNNRNGNHQNIPVEARVSAANQKLVPTTRRRAWPCCQIFVFGKRLGLTLRKVQLFNSKLLVVPYRNLKFDLYPGNFVIGSCGVDYRKKIQLKGQVAQKGGSVYMQKAKALQRYLVVAFMRIDEGSVVESLQKGVKQLMRQVSIIQAQTALDTIVFPISKELCEPIVALNLFAQVLETENSKKVQEVMLATNDAVYFEQCISDFSKYVTQLHENNDLCLQ